MKNITVKSASSKDAAILRHLAKICPPLDVHTQYTYWAVAEYFGDCCFIAYNDEEPIGYIMCIRNDEVFFVWQIGIVKEYRGKGISSLLIKKAFERAESTNYGLISVTIAKENNESFRAFSKYCEKNGYSFDAVETVQVTDLDDPSFSEAEVMYHIRKAK